MLRNRPTGQILHLYETIVQDKASHPGHDEGHPPFFRNRCLLQLEVSRHRTNSGPPGAAYRLPSQQQEDDRHKTDVGKI